MTIDATMMHCIYLMANGRLTSQRELGRLVIVRVYVANAVLAACR